jgi:hypothetical protein
MFIYLVATISSILAIVLRSFLTYINVLPKEDIFKLLGKLDDMLKELNNEKVKNFFSNLINMAIENPVQTYVFVLLTCFIPLWNILFAIKCIKTLTEKLYEQYHDK